MSRHKLLFWGELYPKTTNGISIANHINLKLLKENFDTYVVEEFSDLLAHNTITLKKQFSFLNNIKQLLALSIHNHFKYCYFVLSVSLAGLFKCCLITFLLKTFNPSSKLVIHIHRGDLVSKVDSRVSKILFKIIMKLCHQVICLSKSQKQLYNKRFNTQKFIELENTLLDPSYLESQASNTNKYVYISNYIEEKGIFDLLEAFKSTSIDIKLECYGNYSNKTIAQKLSKYNSDKIKINGPIYDQEKYKVLSSASCLILPSWNEGQPTIILEAMSQGIGIIATDTGLIKEMLPENYPFISPCRNPKKLKKFIESWFKCKQKYFYKEQLQQHFLENFNIDSHKIKLNNIFKK